METARHRAESEKVEQRLRELKAYPEENCKVGDQLLLIPGRHCTTINIYDRLYFVRGGKLVDRVPVESRGERQ